MSTWDVAPRLFDVFDVHDPEDCPTQAMQISDEETHTRNRGQRGAVRAYCDVCESFGHESKDCDATETF